MLQKPTPKAADTPSPAPSRRLARGTLALVSAEPPAVDVALATVTPSEALKHALTMAADNAILTTSSEGLPSRYRCQVTFGGHPELFPEWDSSAARRLPAGTLWTGRAATYTNSGRAPSSPGWNAASGIRQCSGRCLFCMAERRWHRDCPASQEDISEQGRRLRVAALGRTAVPGLPWPDNAVGRVPPASPNPAAAAVAAGVTATIAALHKNHVDVIDEFDVNPENHETAHGETSIHERHAENGVRSAAAETGIEGEASAESEEMP